ncbi:MAG: T9SS type A sorting domain-containing protein [Chitinophagaceae bacterium]
MKKIYFAIFAALAISTVNAQNFNKVWAKFCNGNDYWWFNTGTADNNNVVGLAYNPATNKVLASRRNTKIYVLNASTGALEDSLQVPTGTEAFKHNKIRCTSDGVIYGISLATGAGTCKIYRWASQTSAPTECAAFAVTERTGDAFALSGSGTSTTLYASGAALAGGASNTNIYVLTTFDGNNFLNTATISVPSGSGQWTNRSIDPIGTTPSAGVWVDMSGGPARRLNISGSAPSLTAAVGYTTVTGYNSGQAADAYCGMRYLQTVGNRKYVAFAGANNLGDGVTMRLLNVTDEAAVSTVGTDTLYASGGGLWVYQTNANGTGDVAFKDNGNGSYDIFYLATNNAIACVRTATTLPVELSSFTARLRSNTVSLEWSTTNEINNLGFDVEKSIDGEKFASIGFVKASGNNNGSTYNFNDEKLNNKTGKVFYRLKQIDKDGKFNFSRTEAITINSIKNFSFQLSENPVRGDVRLVLTNETENKLQITVSNSNGQQVYNQQLLSKKGTTNAVIPANSLKAGIYYITVTNGTEKQSVSFVKQ